MEAQQLYGADPAVKQHSARVLLVQDGQVALIERQRAGRLYHVFPGGRVEPGETPAAAAVREAHEELGVQVSILREVARIKHWDILQHYYLVEVTGGQFGAGDGPEMIGEYPPERGTYTAVWLPLAGISAYDVVPETMTRWLLSAQQSGWPENLLYGED